MDPLVTALNAQMQSNMIAPKPKPNKRKCKDCPELVTLPYARCISCRKKARKCKTCPGMADHPFDICASCRSKPTLASKPETSQNATNATFREGELVVSGGQNRESGKRKLEGSYDTSFKKKQKIHVISLDSEQKQQLKPLPEIEPGEMNEFQNELEMVKQLKKIAKRHSAFCACYSIVADPSVPYQAQATVVVRNIKKSANYPFDKKHALELNTTSTSTTVVYRCNCHLIKGRSSKKPLASLSSEQNAGTKSEGPLLTTAPMKPTTTTAEIRAKLALSSTAPSPCDGRIQVTVEEDRSHPLGIPGQRIVVRVHHP